MAIKTYQGRVPQAVGSFVILDAGDPAKMGEEVISAAGIVTGKRNAGEVSQWGEVVSVGELVTVVKVGDIAVMPLNSGGQITSVPHPDWVAGKCSDGDSPTRLVGVHETQLRVIYQSVEDDSE
tara:strand:- start:3527 stop:3895 length:369 start_codon:yes stop_codon:yes gene_type:complete